MSAGSAKAGHGLRAVCCVTGLFVLLAGCAEVGAPGAPKAAAPVLVVAADDPCGAERGEFAKSNSFFTDTIVQDLATGVVIGAVGGAIIGGVTGIGVDKGALIGAGLGAAAGGVGAYSKIMSQKHKDQAELAKGINDDLRKESDEIDHAGASFARLRGCRFLQANDIKTQVRGRKLDRTVAKLRLEQHKSWFDQEIELARKYSVAMAKRDEEFQSATATIRQQELADATQAEAARRAAAVSVPDKRKSFDKSIATASDNGAIAFNIDNGKKVTSLAVPSRA